VTVDESAEPGIQVVRDEPHGRYTILVDGERAGFTLFEVDARGRYLYPHTVIDPRFQGRGLATRLVAEAMADAAARHETVVPYCSVVARYLREHDVPGLDIQWPRLPGQTGPS
jgi:predicted GNAT family acetyltransferase